MDGNEDPMATRVGLGQIRRQHDRSQRGDIHGVELFVPVEGLYVQIFHAQRLLRPKFDFAHKVQK